ncbi:S8 family serine peptidase, partial [Halioglobus sp. HI00S01]
DVLSAIQYVVDNKDYHGIDVLNLSFGAEVQSHYWEDPINIAVMKAWRDGIVVITAAGNEGPDNMTIGVPANVPYVI